MKSKLEVGTLMLRQGEYAIVTAITHNYWHGVLVDSGAHINIPLESLDAPWAISALQAGTRVRRWDGTEATIKRFERGEVYKTVVVLDVNGNSSYAGVVPDCVVGWATVYKPIEPVPAQEASAWQSMSLQEMLRLGPEVLTKLEPLPCGKTAIDRVCELTKAYLNVVCSSYNHFVAKDQEITSVDVVEKVEEKAEKEDAAEPCGHELILGAFKRRCAYRKDHEGFHSEEYGVHAWDDGGTIHLKEPTQL